MHSKKNIYVYSICLLLMLSINLNAQDNTYCKKNFSEDLLKIKNPWLNTHNYSGLYFYAQEKISEVLVNYNNVKGDYARSMDASDIRQFSIGTYSYQKYEGIGIYGKFEYINSYEDNVEWCDMMDPYTGTPFTLGDKIGGDYHKEIFHLKGGMASKFFFDNFYWGVGLDYISGSGGKDNDPRPLNKLMKFEVEPGLTYDINNVRLGMSFLYSYRKEEIDIKSFIDNENYEIYRFRGLGLYTIDEVSNFDRNYFSNKYGLNFQLGFNIGDIKNVTDIGCSYKKENIEDGSNTIKDYSLYEEEALTFKSNFICKKSDLMHSFVLKADFFDRIGTINVVRLESEGLSKVWRKYDGNKDYTQQYSKIGFDYSMYKMKSDCEMDWKAEVSLSIEDSDKEYKYTPFLFEEEYKNLYFNAAITKTFILNNKSLFVINLNGGYKSNLDKNIYVLDRSNMNDLLVDNIGDYMVESVVRTDYEWNKGDYLKMGGYVKYAHDIKMGNKVNSAYLKLATDYSKVKTGMFDGESRTNISASLGVVF